MSFISNQVHRYDRMVEDIQPADFRAGRMSPLDSFVKFAEQCGACLTSQEIVNRYLQLGCEDQVDALEIFVKGKYGEEGDRFFNRLFSLSSSAVQTALIIDDENKEEWTWAHLAAIFKRDIIMQHLLDVDFNVRSITNPTGWTPLQIALTNESFSSNPVLMETLKKKDALLTEQVLRAKIWGIRFSLSGPLFEGTAPIIHNLPMYESIERTLAIAREDIEHGSLGEKIFTAVDDAVYKVIKQTPEERRDSLSKTSWVMLDTGYNKHATIHLFSHEEKYCVKINTGSGKYRGFKAYKIEKYDLISIKVMMSILSCLKEKSVSFSLSKDYWKYVKKKLNLKRVVFFEAAQTVKNCGWESRLVAVRALFMFIHQRKASGCSNQEAFRNYHVWKRVDDQEAFEQLMITLRELPDTLYDKQKIIDEIFYYAGKKAFLEDDHFLAFLLTEQHHYADLITIDLKSFRDPKTGRSLVRMAFQRQWSHVIIQFIRLNVDFNLPDGEGKTIFDDAARLKLTGLLVNDLSQWYQEKASQEERQRFSDLARKLMWIP